MKKMISLLTALTLVLTLFAGCGAAPAATTAAAPETTEATEPILTGPAALDGKKIMFVGNSYTYLGNCVLSKSDLRQNERIYDQGLFFQLCKLHGAEVNVTNWCFGGHSSNQIFASVCGKSGACENECHENYIIDPYYDYVAIQPYYESGYAGNLQKHLQHIVDFFRKHNPNVKFLLMVPHMAYDLDFRWRNDLEDLDPNDFIICNWGGMLNDIVQGTVKVPGATQEYLRSSFVCSITEDDGHHQNLLAGYITTLMAYCAITGESAVGQPYDFASDASINPKFDWELFRSEKYVYDPTTNFIEIYNSPEDMKGLQMLVDEYLAKYNPER